MNTPRNVMYHGSRNDLPELRELRAGPVTLKLEDADLRYIRLGEHELVRRVYAAVRDPHWMTIPPRYSNWHIDAQPRAFRVEFDADHIQNEINFHWHGTISGTEQGTIRYTMDGEVRSTFWRNRIGFCVLHPMDAAGAPVVVEHVNGPAEESFFPTRIAPQLIVEGRQTPVAPFAEMRSVSHRVAEGVWAKVEFAGDIFELEDQRNWTDASFKTYSTPLRLPFPVEVRAGEKISQTITLSFEGSFPNAASQTDEIVISPDAAQIFTLPRIGLGAASHGEPLSQPASERLRLLSLQHLRLDLDLASNDVAAHLARGWGDAQRIGAALEAALFLSDDAGQELERFQKALTRVKPKVARWLVFDKREPNTAARWLELSRQTLAAYDPAIPIYGGTNVYFRELNREPLPHAALDGVSYSVNPQAHAFDLRSLAECPPTIGVTISSARAFCGDKPLAISPITLRPRFNPHIVGPQPPTPPGELPFNVDPRQMSLFGAGWTLAALKAVIEAGLDSVTFYETTGWRGTMERDAGSPLPEKFLSRAGMVFPLYHVFADAAELPDAVAVKSVSSQPLKVETLLLRSGNTNRLMLVNLTNEPQQVRLTGITANELSIARLNEFTFESATMQPEKFRAGDRERIKTPRVSGHPWGLDTIVDGKVLVSLHPFEYVRVDWIDQE